MVYIFWGLLNFAFFLLFIFLLVRVTRLIREKFGYFAAIVFVITIVCFSIYSNQKELRLTDKTNQARKWEFSSSESIDSNTLNFIDLRVEENLTNTVQLHILYGKRLSDNIYLPRSASSGFTGFVSGLNWVPTAISVNRTSNNLKFDYRITGLMEFKLLGFVIFSKSKLFQGFVNIK
ncbi:MAG: hypothetical protein RLY16_1394 [Bacteroidota bacterium]|jgi:hypothetical protein